MRGLLVPAGLRPFGRQENSDEIALRDRRHLVRPGENAPVSGNYCLTALDDEAGNPCFIGGAGRMKIADMRQFPTSRKCD